MEIAQKYYLVLLNDDQKKYVQLLQYSLFKEKCPFFFDATMEDDFSVRLNLMTHIKCVSIRKNIENINAKGAIVDITTNAWSKQNH